MKEPVLEAAPETVHWGYLSGSLKPVASIESGGTITVSVTAGAPDPVANSPYPLPENMARIHREVTNKRIPGHLCTGPIEVRGAKAGSALQVDILSVEADADWGYTTIRPQQGALPDDFDEINFAYSKIDRERRVATLPWGAELPLAPFFGLMTVAPPLGWGSISTIPPRRNGGNIDNRELQAGATLFLPVFVDGALFSVGDGHGMQGDGEVCSQALEAPLKGRFRLTTRDDLSLTWPMAETDTHIITMAFGDNLDACARTALRQMIDLLADKVGLSRPDAFTLLSLAGSLRITQMVNINKGVHLMLEKTTVSRDNLLR